MFMREETDCLVYDLICDELCRCREGGVGAIAMLTAFDILRWLGAL